ncbi:transmembrane amino acid transporter protein-domain-containing protein [Halteromyces radiatus]|uniref:transmembrane amino acid transporter protein-domain-containing protein n=1 Tax=Halteromyces radiatus TaxID=101107 RepID=UPI00221F06E9|nr:transmembrane amino acid transporter protein-domain-containing protein [Halteromyces radiatus]KAI8096705.1 transmembrane amino acid transporter protein-domain-containing protein [Halteromyces radiatus]
MDLSYSVEKDKESQHVIHYDNSQRTSCRTADTTTADKMEDECSSCHAVEISILAGAYQDTPSSTLKTDGNDMTKKKSGFIQSIFNTINLLAGVGILAIPLGFMYAGWVISLILFVFSTVMTIYTANILGRCLDAYPEAQTIGDLAHNAFGQRGRFFISAIFWAELITCSVGLVVLLTDGLISLFPNIDPFLIRTITFLILTPMLFLPIRHLAYTSLIGILSVLCIAVVLTIDGATKMTSPGSLIIPADTASWPENWMIFPRCIGLFMAALSGTACLPSIYRDMENPKQYTSMVYWGYMITALIFLTIGVAGYRMFGSGTMQEVTQNVMMIPEYNQGMNQVAVWLFALSPIVKYGLILHPVNLSWQLALIRQPSIEAWFYRHPWGKQSVIVVGKMMVSALVVLLACGIPRFDRIMSFFGACFSYIISGLFPTLCYLKLFGHIPLWEKIILYALFFLCLIMSIVGTIWTFL